MARSTKSVFEIPVQLAQVCYVGTEFVSLGRFPEFTGYATGNIAAAGSVTLITGVANQKIVLLKVIWSFDAVTHIQLLDAVSPFVGWMTTNANLLPVDYFPYGFTLVAGDSLIMKNIGAAATNYDVSVYYTFDAG